MRMIRRLTARGVPSFIARIAWGATRVLWRSIAGNRGLSVVVLGPDGSGKSSVVESLRQDLSPAFIASERRTFPPALLKRGSGSSSTPHAVRPRSWVSSVVRALGYWLVYYTMGYYFTVHRSLARGRLVVHDRHLVDALVDPKRYRYGGPTGLLRFIWRCARKPDLVVLLDAPADVIQSRKQEVPLAETQRQVREYRELVIAMPNGRIIDAARPLADVTADVNELVLTYLARRAARRLGLEPVA